MGQYRYRKHINYLKYAIPVFLMMAVAAILLLAVLAGFPGKIIDILGVVLIVIIVEAIVIYVVMHRFSVIRIELENDFMTYTNYKGKTVVRYEDITALQFRFLIYFGGWVKIKSVNKTLKLTVVVENIHGLLHELKDQLDRRGLSHKYDADKFFKFFKTAAYTDESWCRLYKIWWKLLLLTILTTTITVAESGLGLWLSIMLVLFPILIYLVTEVVFVVRLARQSDRTNFTVPNEDLVYTNMVYKKAVFWGAILFAVITIAQVW